ncbi:hypothetical protein [Pseudovibrio sp. WM33]|uniref:hypothetical protein n=1 Tax=Pseudovibrio sp. WM33 TaxID=1735585 RepID=UPI0007AE6552|nr:hypothetical protein [Pseudovibrio sp. WM33]KZL23683.1 hypothetical protein PsWM33_02971 [Pseudovibrio sp. WM33]
MRHWFKDSLIAFATIGGVLGFTYVLLSLFMGPVWIDANKLLIFVHMIYIAIILAGLWYHVSTKANDPYALPKVRNVTADGILLVNRSPWLGNRVQVSIFLLQNEFEQMLCQGVVINVQENSLVQIATQSTEYDDQELLRTIKENKEELLIKPGVVS